MAEHLERFGKGRHHRLPQRIGTFAARGTAPQQHEFITGQPAKDIPRPHPFTQPRNHLDQQVITHMMAHGFVDRLEMIEIDVGQVDLLFGPFSITGNLGQHGRQTLHHMGAIGQAQNRIVQRVVLGLCLAGGQLTGDLDRPAHHEPAKPQHRHEETEIGGEQRQGAIADQRTDLIGPPRKPAERAASAVGESQLVMCRFIRRRARETQARQHESRPERLQHRLIQPPHRYHMIGPQAQQAEIPVRNDRNHRHDRRLTCQIDETRNSA